MSERKMWEEKEDNMIRKIVKENQNRSQEEKWKWSEIAEILQKRISNCKRSGKQCRERWYNHLDPTIIKDKQLTKPEIDKLFQLQSRMGNRWANIAKQFPGRTDNNLKNFFYSSLRRAIRQINFFVSHYKKKSNIKPFKQTILTKILNISDQKYRQKLDIKSQRADELARSKKIFNSDVKDMLAKLSLDDQDKQLNSVDIDFRQKLVRSIQQFNKNCKKRKSKRVEQDEEPDLDELSQYNGDNKSSMSQQQLKLTKQKTPRKSQPKSDPINLQNKPQTKHKTNKNKNQQQLNNKEPQPLFQKPINDEADGKKLRKKRSDIDLLLEHQDNFGLQAKKISSKMDSRSSGKDNFKQESSQFFRKSNASIGGQLNQPFKLTLKRSSYQQKYPSFIANMEPWKRGQSKLENSLFQSFPQNSLDPLMLESLNIGENIGKINDGSIGQSGFLRILKGDSKTDQGNLN